MTNPVFSATRRAGLFAPVVVMLAAFAIAPVLFSASAFSQGRELSLADILIALRSKKAPLADRNKLLAEAVSDRGTTFSLTPEIEKELSGTGASTALINSIRKASHKESPDAAAAVFEPAEEPPVVDISRDPAALELRANESVKNGDLDAAIIDLTKAIDLAPTSASPLMTRARVYLSRNLFTLAIADLSKALEIDPNNASAYSLRGRAHERKFDNKQAIEDFKKAFELDATDEIARAAVDKWNAEQAKLQPKQNPDPMPVPDVRRSLPEYVDLGQLSDHQTVKLVKPVYSRAAINARISGQVIVEVELDKEGNVTKAKTKTGHPYLRRSSEDAALESKFKPATFDGVPVKAKGTVVYNYVPNTFR